jgi:phosphate-selective porin
MTHGFHAIALGLALLLGAALSAPAMAAATSPHDGKTRTIKEKKKSTKVKFDKGSGETTSERERRLYRECRGRPNAGACEGFAQ